MRIRRPLVEGTFVRRDNRFRATVLVGGRFTKAHVPNSGRLHELFRPGQSVLLAHVPAPHRVTDYDLIMVRLGDQLVSMDARLPGRLFHEAVAAGRLDAFAGYTHIEPEVRFGESRLDFRLEKAGEQCYVEVKSVTLVEDGCGLFPDAPTLRGQRHVRELMAARRAGHRAAAVFVIQRSDARCFRPHATADPAFAEVLQEAREAGVEVYAFTCVVTLDQVVIDRPAAIAF
ncbi:MAG: DNA/RNA nuclease SfsA [Chloroflexi bacterium]|nr:MAG: DNA/RNA nuclease SfsA [Chloroflexota bacterium]